MSDPEIIPISIDEVDGFYMINDIFTESEHSYYFELLKNVNENLCHQIHHANEFGWKFLPLKDENSNIIIRKKNDNLGNFPEWIDEIWIKIRKHILKLTNCNLPKELTECTKPNHLLVNKYEPGDGVIPHFDELEFWENWVIGVSLGSGCVFNLTRKGKKVKIYLPKNSIYILTRDARYEWKHGIEFVKEDNVYGNTIERSLRISMTFRNIHKKWFDDEIIKNI